MNACCRPSDHQWQPLKRGSSRERCTKCRSVFPCSHDCQHVDCRTERGQALPDWITYVRPEALPLLDDEPSE